MSRWRRRGTDWTAEAVDRTAMQALGVDLGGVLRPGDVVVLDGPLGAGKTTLTQGIGQALGVRGAVTSPTFVIARVHPGPGAALVHVDAYRLGSAVEVEDLDLDADLESAVTVVEWGVGKVEGLAPDRLEVSIARPAAGPASVDGHGGDDPTGDEDPADEDPAGGVRTVVVRGVGPRWAGLVLPAG